MTMIDTPNGIQYAMWAARKGAVRLESIGLRHSKIGSVRKLCCRDLGLKLSTKAPEVIAAIEAKMAALLAARDAEVQQ